MLSVDAMSIYMFITTTPLSSLCYRERAMCRQFNDGSFQGVEPGQHFTAMFVVSGYSNNRNYAMKLHF